MNWLSDLERKYGRFCIPNLTTILVAGQILVYAIELFVNQFITVYLGLNRFLLFSGEIWRLITFVFIPFSGGGPLSVILGIYFTWFIGTALESLPALSPALPPTPIACRCRCCWPLPCSTPRCRCCFSSSSRCGSNISVCLPLCFGRSAS